ncbi:MAG: hypothetical protein JO176_01995 [Acidimicrobiia bacterium]|nr:hypothetical protein [Acidimicrobiia bacterium]
MRRRVRWAIGSVSAALIVAGAVGAGPVSGAGAAGEPGIGSSYAQSLQITPHEGSLAVGVVLGEALAGHTNSVARAQSQGEDLGSIGLSLEGYNCGKQPSAEQVALIPQALQAETPGPGQKEEKTLQPTDGLSKASPTNWPPSWGSTEHVLADGTPYGQADTAYGQLAGGGFSISGTRSKAWSGLVDGQRVAAATSDIGEINLAGQVVLQGLHWEATYPTGGSSAQPKGTFTIGHLTIGGQTVPTADVSAAIAAVNKVLTNLGVQISLPKLETIQGVQFVGPLELLWLPNANRDKIVRSASVPGQSVLHPIEDGLENGFSPSEPQALVQAICQSDTPITVADITIAAFTGGGYFNMALGGVNATSGDIPANQYNLSVFQPSSTPGLDVTSAGTAAIPGTAGTAGTAGTLGTGAADLGGGGGSKAPSVLGRRIEPAVHTSHESGPLLAIGLGGLGLLALLAEGDRRTMGRARKRLKFDFEE